MENSKLPVLPSENLILFDWLSFTSRVDDLSSIICLLGLEGIQFTEGRGKNGFAHAMFYDHIGIYYDPGFDFEGVWVDMSGQGCRVYETYSSVGFNKLFEYFREYKDDYHVTRLDVAFDDHTGVLPLKKIVDDVLDMNYVSKFQDKSMLVEIHAGHVGHTVYCGSVKSELRFRIYDKAYERGYDSNTHWVRFEMQLRNDRAYNFIDQLQSKCVGKLFRDVIINYLRFVVPNKTDTNKRRWGFRGYWKKFIGEAEAVSLVTVCKTDYNLAACERYVYKQCGNSLDTLVQIKGWETVINELKLYKPARSVKYKDLINSNNCIKNDPILKYIQERKKEK